MFTPQAIGSMDSPYKDPAAIPKGLGAKARRGRHPPHPAEFEVGDLGLRPLPRLRSARHIPPSTIDTMACLPHDRHAVQIGETLAVVGGEQDFDFGLGRWDHDLNADFNMRHVWFTSLRRRMRLAHARSSRSLRLS
jgi:hypothetical protein